MTTVAAWVLVPLLGGALSLGCGLLLELAAGLRLRFPLLLAAGFAVVVVAAQFPALSRPTAPLAAPLVVALALAGIGLSLPRLRDRFDGSAAVAALAVFASYAAPIVVSAQVSFAGYVKLDDTATYLAMLDRVETDGRSLAGLAPSTYEATLATSLGYGYPLGSFAPLGVLQRLLGIDAAWLWQPYLATLAALLGLALWALAAPLVERRPLRAAVAVVAAQPALLYGYALWGGIKELAMALLVATLCACIPLTLEARTVRAVLPLAAVSAAVVGVLSVGGAVWLLPLVPAVVLLWRQRGLAFSARAVGAFAVAGAALALPAIAAAVEWLGHTAAFTGETELGNLIGPLKLWQIAGIWPVADFRVSPNDLTPVYVLVGVAAAAAAVGLRQAWVRRAWGHLLYVVCAVGVALLVFGLGSPWIGAKALATAAPALLLVALSGAAALFAVGRRVEAAVVAAAVVGGVAWSNVLAYREVWVAPRARLADLEAIGSRFAGDGPALMTEFEPYGARHFLRRADAEGTSELRRHVVPLRSGQPLAPQSYADIDRFRLPDLLAYRLLVLRRSPVASRPPSAYRLVEQRRWYDVWQRRSGVRVIEHVPLGGALSPGSVPPCTTVLGLARLRGVSRLVAVPRDEVVVVPFETEALPSGWSANDDGTVDARTSASFSAAVRLARSGRYGIWVGGSFVGRISTAVDGADVGSARHELEWPGNFVEVGRTQLTAGEHRVAIRYSVGGWRAGSHGLAPFPLGPIVIAPTTEPQAVSVAPSRAASLCGRRLDWIEAVG